MNIAGYCKEIFNTEIEELEAVRDRIGNEIEKVCQMIMNCEGKVVVTGIGKSGLIGKKIAATLASTGTTAVFMNSAEGLHGDLGMIRSCDIVVAISNSGNSDEVVAIIPSIKKIGAKIIAMTGNRHSKLGQNSNIVLDVGVAKEACPMNLAPTSSTTATLVMGDALAACLIKLRDFRPENFAVYHPGGSLGRRLLTRVKDIMNSGDKIPTVTEDASIDEIIYEISRKGLGMTCVINECEVAGIITDGDIRRLIQKNRESIFKLRAKDMMTGKFIFIESDKMAVDALQLMEERESKISSLPVIDDEELVGLVTIHDLLNVK